jgi:hypothetical protein
VICGGNNQVVALAAQPQTSGGVERMTKYRGIVKEGVVVHHFEIVAATPMTLVEYEMALSKVVLVPV